MCITDRRSVARFDLDKSVCAYIKNHHVPGKIFDLSTAGACLELQDAYQPDTNLTLIIDFSDLIPDCLFQFQALIVWSKPVETGLDIDSKIKYRHGVFFTFVNDEDLARLSRILHIIETQEFED